MSSERELLIELISKNGNCVNLGRMLRARYPNLWNWILDNTVFLNNKQNLKFNERIFCIVNGITSIKFNTFGEPANFVNLFVGYSLKQILHKKLKKGEQNRNDKQYLIFSIK